MESDCDKESIPEEIYEFDLIVGYMNNCDSGLNKYDIYHYKSMKLTKEIWIKNKISDHNILTREANVMLNRTEIYTEVDIADKNYVSSNNDILNEIRITKSMRKFLTLIKK